MRKIAFTFLLVLAVARALAQHDVNTTLCFSDTVKFSFSSEWQYLSTDIYLFNGEKFSKLINEMNFEPKRGWLKKNWSQEELEYLFITAQLKDVKFFGDKDIAYPIYNFQVNRDKDNKYQTFVSDKIDKIRIIDNLPLYTASDKIDAEIKVRAITTNERDQLISLVATQLQTMSKIPTPTTAVFSLLKEFGNFLEANSKRKEYRFSSTIRLFEQKNFDTRLHSIKIYSLTTDKSRPLTLNTSNLKSYMDTVRTSEINRDVLDSLLRYRQYPLIVVANYKSLYKMEQIRGDEVNQSNIDKRKLRIENDFKAGLINGETYRQEKDFINFLTVFSGLKGMMEIYSLNYRMGNPDAVTNGLFKVLQGYRQLLKLYDEIEFKYRNNSTFLTVFKSEYTSILGFASLYLEDDQNLKQTKNLVKTMVALEKEIKLVDPYVCENNLRNLRFSDIFKRANLEQAIEGQIIINQIGLLEKFIFEKSFAPEIAKLGTVKPLPQNVSAPEKLKEKANNTACVTCREQSLAAIKDFYDGLNSYYKAIALRRRDSIALVVENKLFSYFDKTELIEKNIKYQYRDTLPASVEFLRGKLLEIKRDMGNLNDFTKINVADKPLNIIDELNSKLVGLIGSIEENLSYIAEKRPDFVKPVPVQPAKVDKPVEEIKTPAAIEDKKPAEVENHPTTEHPKVEVKPVEPTKQEVKTE
ncbi:hypothetical protein [Alistipes sp. ZOR0009]|uniref:hypothetical protein n=1 Tax=Alistipes sp. ZOR0009 TaxID=1339253 RepID=UPI00068BD1FB|nr:hypothetical protein [Alistipes sp. ZOR0009]